MSVSSILNPATGKIYDDLVPQGGGVPLAKGGLITANAGGAEQALAVGNDGWVLSADSNEALGLKYIQLPAGGIQFTQQGQLLYAGAGPAFNDSLLNIGNAGQILGINAGIPAWINAGGSGTITALAPLTEYADGTASKVAVNFTGKGDLIVGGGVQVGGEPVAGVILPVGANDMVLTANSATASGLEWKASGGGSSATIFRNSVDDTPLVITKPATANDTCVITADRTYHAYNTQIYSKGGVGTQVDMTNPQPFPFFTWTAPNDINMTSVSSQVKIITNSIYGQTVHLDIYDSTGTTGLVGGDPVNVSDNEPAGDAVSLPITTAFQFVNGTTYQFMVSLDGLDQGEFFDMFIDGGQYVGNITINGVDYANLPATFTLAPPYKFRVSNDLTGKTSATCENFSSQSFVASEDTNSWIAVGGINAGVAFVP
ncbi:hypothetical protein [Dishui lake virophage 1]|nr:hypothetical protein [Dishui lake virophage 1]QIG59445.1 hypothetical protein [Dishui Lake virophage 7]